jgi:hypothetical protein
MIDVTKGPDTTLRERGRTAEGASPDLSALRMETAAANSPLHHTMASIQQKWGEKTFHTGLMIEGRQLGGAS